MDTPSNLNDLVKERFPERHMSAIARALIKLATDRAVRSELPQLDLHVCRFISSLEKGDPLSSESALVSLYSCLHSAGSRYSPAEQRHLKARGGYASYPGGFSPLIRAEPFIRPESRIADLGAGNGLQGLFFQSLYPHHKTLQIELSAEMIRLGMIFQHALGIEQDRVEWINDDIVNVPIHDIDFLYLYRPARPFEGGRDIYNAIAGKLLAGEKPRVIFSIADCLAEYLDDRFSVFYTDGHLTCFRKE